MKKLYISLALVAIAGLSNGLHETLHYHYGQFEAMFPNADPNYWNPDLSWRCKYKSGDPALGPRFFLSNTAFVAFTDAKHLLGETHRATLAIGMWVFGFWYRTLKWRCHFALILGWAFGLWIWQACWFHLVYSLIF